MNERTDHVLDAIDHAIADWETSPDAMRWTPDPAPTDTRPAGARRVPMLRPNPVTVSAAGFRGLRPQFVVLDEMSVSLGPIPMPRIEIPRLAEIRFQPVIVHPVDAARLSASFRDGLTQALRDMSPALVGLGRTFARLGEALTERGLIAEPPPSDPRERALWLRQHRNTGPARDPFARRTQSTRSTRH